jgi:general secretion pathway protein M
VQMQPQGERVTVQLKAVPATALAQWLSQAREQAQALPLEAHLTRSANANNASAIMWDGSMVLRLPNRSTP